MPTSTNTCEITISAKMQVRAVEILPTSTNTRALHTAWQSTRIARVHMCGKNIIERQLDHHACIITTKFMQCVHHMMQQIRHRRTCVVQCVIDDTCIYIHACLLEVHALHPCMHGNQKCGDRRTPAHCTTASVAFGRFGRVGGNVVEDRMNDTGQTNDHIALT